MQFAPKKDRQLRGLRPGKNHAMAQSIQERVILYPLPFLDQFLMHDGEVSGRPSKGDPAQLPPKSKRLSQRRRTGLGRIISCRAGSCPYAGL